MATTITHTTTRKSSNDTENPAIASPQPMESPSVPSPVRKLAQELFVRPEKCVFETDVAALPLLKSTQSLTGSRTENGAISYECALSLADEYPPVTSATPVPNKETKYRLEVPSKFRGRADTVMRELIDVRLVCACWDIVYSFMRDGPNDCCLEQSQGTQLIETTVGERQNRFASKKRPWLTQQPRDNTTIIDDSSHGQLSSIHRRRLDSMHVSGGVDDSGYDSSGDWSSRSKPYVGIEKDALQKMSVLEKVRFVVTLGLHVKPLRDEIYCQIIKQLTLNPSLRSTALGWILLSLIAGCFSPTKHVLPYVEDVLSQNVSPGSAYCAEKLDKVLRNGDRLNPPSCLELQAAKSRQPIRLPVICMDHSVRTMYVESSTTAREMCRKVAQKIQLGDSFGFSLYLALDSKVVPLGSRNLHVMDAISQTEHHCQLNDVHNTWRVYFRREFFSPRDAAGLHDNQMKSWLTYSQICGGVRSGEYECRKAQDLALLMAHRYCIQHRLHDPIDRSKVLALCDHDLPIAIPRQDHRKWIEMVITTLHAIKEKLRKTGGSLDEVEIMEQVTRYAARAFLDDFTKSFALTSFQAHCQGDVIAGDDLVLMLNHVSLSVVVVRHYRHNSFQRRKNSDKLLETSLVQVRSVVRADGCWFRLTLRSGSEHLLRSLQIEEILIIVKRFLDDLKISAENESAA